MAWIEVHQALVSHRKTMRLSALLRCSRAQTVGHLVCLWLWAIDNSDENGLLACASATEVAMAAAWEKQPETFLAALVEAGFAEQGDSGITIHDWDEYGGRLVRERMANAARAKRARERARNAPRNAPRNANVGEPFDATQHNSTQHNRSTTASSLGDGDNADIDISDPREGHDPAWRDRYGTVATAIGIIADQRMADEVAQLADEFTLEQLQRAVRDCRSSNRRPWPSELRKHLPQIQNGSKNAAPWREPEFVLPEVER